MFDIGWQEILLTLVVALLVMGPKDLPRAFYTAGRWARALRKLTGKVQQTLDKIMHEAEMDEMNRQIKALDERPSGSPPPAL